MRVIAGSLRGRRIDAPRGTNTRPTSDRVREALFSILTSIDGARMQGARVLDLFAGSGALGIEALSRGAGSAIFVERDDAALTALRGNLDSLGLAGPSVEVRATDALASLRRSVTADERFELIFLDPPYALAERLAPALDEHVPQLLCGGGIVAVESDVRMALTLALPLLRERRYGDTCIRVHRAEARERLDCGPR
jgi:16S rRNA (guanine966-N2)-methyltransferase